MHIDIAVLFSCHEDHLPSHFLPRWSEPVVSGTKALGQELPERRNRPLVLVADDEQIIAETLIAILSEEGFDVASANDGLAALEEAARLCPDIVLLDVAMPRLNGVEAAKRILSSMPKVRVVLFSGQAETADLLAEAREAGFEFEVLAKPVKPDALLRTLRSSGRNP
jgi:CheY-like chemotaxis protein